MKRISCFRYLSRRDQLAILIAYHLLPRRVIYWAMCRAGGDWLVRHPDRHPTDVNLHELMAEW